jgi:PAS domain S-box-containing protein
MQRYFESGEGPVLKRLNHRIETLALRSDGSVFPVEMSNVAVKVDGVTYFTTNVRDISVARKAAAELDLTLSHYQELADALELQKQGFDHHAIVSISDAEEKIVYANDKLVEILGYSREELIGRKYYEFRQRLPQDVYQGLRSSLAEGHVWHGELAMRRRDGSKYWVSNTSVPIFDENGAIKQYITVQTDISDLRQTEIDLAQARTRELEVGALIQQSLLAANPIKDMAGLWMTAYNQPSKGMDGDFVEVIRMGEHCLDILAGDVMGKGSLAGLMGAGTKLKFIRSIVELLAAENRGTEPPPPSAIVASMHKTMTPHLQELEAFVTLVYVRIDTLRNVITWIGCGHEETLIIRANGDLQTLSNQHPPLGILDHDEFSQGETHLGVGDAVFLCSDGLSDAVRPDGQRVGRDLVNQAVRQMIPEHRAPAAVLHALRLKVLHKGVHVNDDVTMVLVMRTSGLESEARCELPIELDSLRAAREFVMLQALRAGMPEQDASLFTVASIEIFTNIVRHGQGLLDNAPVELLVRRRSADFVLDIVHLGEAFVPPDEEVETDFAAFPEGGFGLTIIRHACDRVDFLHHDGVNTVRMCRRIET